MAIGVYVFQGKRFPSGMTVLACTHVQLLWTSMAVEHCWCHLTHINSDALPSTHMQNFCLHICSLHASYSFRNRSFCQNFRATLLSSWISHEAGLPFLKTLVFTHLHMYLILMCLSRLSIQPFFLENAPAPGRSFSPVPSKHCWCFPCEGQCCLLGECRKVLTLAAGDQNTFPLLLLSTCHWKMLLLLPIGDRAK